MRKLLVMVLMLVASPAFARTLKTSFVQSHFVSTVSVSNSSATGQVQLSGTMAAIVQVQLPQDPCLPPILAARCPFFNRALSRAEVQSIFSSTP